MHPFDSGLVSGSDCVSQLLRLTAKLLEVRALRQLVCVHVYLLTLTLRPALEG
jgi:hypothetical protein